MQKTDTVTAPSARRPRIMRTREQWQTLIEQLKTSTLTKKAFCVQHSITPSSLHKWQKVFAKASVSKPFIDITDRVNPAPVYTEQPSQDWQVELALGEDVVLRLNTGKP